MELIDRDVIMNYNMQPPTCLTYKLKLFHYCNQSFIFLNMLIFPQFIRFILFLPFFLVIAVVLALSFSPCSYALSAYSINVIHGSAPYLTFDKGRTRITDTNNLLAITLSDGRKITPDTNDSLITPIELPRVGDSFADIGMLVPTN